MNDHVRINATVTRREPPEIVTKIFVAGATGAIGLPLVRELCTLGHKVTGMTRSKRASIVCRNSAPTRFMPMPSIRKRCGLRSRQPRRMS